MRAVHRIRHLSSGEINLYETYPGSRFLQAPFSAGGSQNDTSIDDVNSMREDLVRAVADAVASNVQHIQLTTPIVQMNTCELIAAFNLMRESVVNAIGASIQTGLKRALEELAEQFNISTRHEISNTGVGGVTDAPVMPPESVTTSGENVTVPVNSPVHDGITTDLDKFNATTNSDEDLLTVDTQEMVPVSQIIADLAATEVSISLILNASHIIQLFSPT